jgi:hypothetical protein
MNIENVFGINVHSQFMEWFDGEYAEQFAQRYPDKGISLIILDPDMSLASMYGWRDPLVNAIIAAHIGDDDAAHGSGGTQDNVAGKLQFVLRTGYDSEFARIRPHLLREGDFPYQGAGSYEDFFGGVSGLAQEDDWAEFQVCVDKLIVLLSAAGNAAVAEAARLRELPDTPVDVKYLRGINLAPDET